jgi:hypothetical protein
VIFSSFRKHWLAGFSSSGVKYVGHQQNKRRKIMPKNWALIGVCALLFAFAAEAHSQNESKPVVSLSPLTGEQLSVYRAILAGWISKDTPVVNLADRTIPYSDSGPAGTMNCGKGFDLEPLSATLVHQFQVSDLTQLGSVNINLVGPKRGKKDVKNNDPWKSIQNGQSVEDSVRNGFAHGLFTLSEIQFDKKHEHAIVSYSFVCGGLCGNGGTVVMEKTADGWREMKQCDNWISSAAQEPRCVAFASRP